MAAINRWTPAVAVLASLALVACAHASGVGEEDQSAIGMGGGVGEPGCKPESGCSSCTGCIASCVCATGDKVGCVESCGPPGGPPPSPDPPPPPGGGGTPAAGGGDNGGGPSSGGGGSGGTSGTAGNGGTSGGNGGASGGSGGTPPGACTYPPGPYGTSVGQVVKPTLSWQGFFEGATTASTISIQDYFDCDGTRGITALFLSQGALWCGACQAEASEMNGLMSGGWTKKGIKVLSLIIEDSQGNPAQLKHAEAWKNKYGAKAWSVAADPSFTFQGPGSNGLPLGIVVDPRTMKIVDKSEGFDPTDPTLEQLAAKNAK